MSTTENAKKKILVVDDEDNIRFLYKEELEEAGYSVNLASNTEDALKEIQRECPDLITLDIKMPGMNGIDFLDVLKKDHSNIPVIFCSAYGSFKQDFRVWASDAYVVKSADLRELKLTIKDILDL